MYSRTVNNNILKDDHIAKLMYNYGTHHMLFECCNGDFYDIIDELSKEFEITKKDSERGNTVLYFITNYYGDLEYIGSIDLNFETYTRRLASKMPLRFRIGQRMNGRNKKYIVRNGHLYHGG